MSIVYSSKYMGEANVPKDVLRRRHFVYEAMRRFGTPVLVKHMWNAQDAENGLAVKSPNLHDAYGQTRNNDPLSFGVGFVSAEDSENEWIHPTTSAIVVSDASPGVGYVLAPRFRGYGPGHLIHVIEPDVAEDIYKLTAGGVLIQAQLALVQAPWYPEINDNDLLINVVVNGLGEIVDTRERYLAKQSNQVSMRGRDRRGRREYSEDGGNRHVINQTFEMTLLPSNHVLQGIDTDR